MIIYQCLSGFRDVNAKRATPKPVLRAPNNTCCAGNTPNLQPEDQIKTARLPSDLSATGDPARKDSSPHSSQTASS